ncbi:hypothetical protein V6N13_071301 [Hibiscus sabdariffa]
MENIDGGEGRSRKGGYPIHYASLRDSRSFKDVLLNAGPKDLKRQDQDERALKDLSAGLITRRSEALGSDRVTTIVGGHVDDVEVEVVSVYPKPAVANDAKWHISIKKEEMNWFRCSLVGLEERFWYIVASGNSKDKSISPNKVSSSDKCLEHVANTQVDFSFSSKNNLHEVQMMSDTNLVLDGKMNRFVDPNGGDMDGFSISHGSRLQYVEVGLFNEGC